jgi:hypothetical protein
MRGTRSKHRAMINTDVTLAGKLRGDSLVDIDVDGRIVT